MDHWLFFILLTLISATVGTMTGFGTSTIMVPTLALFLPLPQVLLFVGIIHWFGNVWKMLLFKEGFNWKLILLFGLPGVIVSPVVERRRKSLIASKSLGGPGRKSTARGRR